MCYFIKLCNAHRFSFQCTSIHANAACAFKWNAYRSLRFILLLPYFRCLSFNFIVCQPNDSLAARSLHKISSTYKYLNNGTFSISELNFTHTHGKTQRHAHRRRWRKKKYEIKLQLDFIFLWWKIIRKHARTQT